MDVNIEMIDKALVIVRSELIRATKLHGPMRSMHEGFAVLNEEVDELWDEVKRNDQISAWNEAVQVAAMATRFMIDNEPPTVPLNALAALPPSDYCPARAVAVRQVKELADPYDASPVRGRAK